MAIDLPFRLRAVRSLTNDLGCYGLCSLNQGAMAQSVDGAESSDGRVGDGVGPRCTVKVEREAAKINSRRRRVGDRVTYDRSAVMRAVKSRDTSTELAVRALLRPIAPGYRLHRGDLPGKPDVPESSRFSSTAVSGTAMIARAARGRQRPTPPIGAQRSPATGRAT
jgi:hypothetical protein